MAPFVSSKIATCIIKTQEEYYSYLALVLLNFVLLEIVNLEYAILYTSKCIHWHKVIFHGILTRFMHIITHFSSFL